MRLCVMLGVLLPICALFLTSCAPANTGDETIPTPSNASAEVVLPDPAPAGDMSLEEALGARRSVRTFRAEPLGLDTLSQLLWSAQGITDEMRGLRTAPSAGATYPLETCVVAGDVSGLVPGVYRYHPDVNRLSLIREGDVRRQLAGAALSQQFIADAPATVVLACVYERTAQRYGDRAERYVHMEAGHAAQNFALQAVALGLGTVPVGAFDDDRVAEILGLEDDEAPLYLLPVGRR